MTGMQDRLDAVVLRQVKQLRAIGALLVVVGVAMLALGIWGALYPDYPGDKSGARLAVYGLILGASGVPTLWRARTIARRVRTKDPATTA